MRDALIISDTTPGRAGARKKRAGERGSRVECERGAQGSEFLGKTDTGPSSFETKPTSVPRLDLPDFMTSDIQERGHGTVERDGGPVNLDHSGFGGVDPLAGLAELSQATGSQLHPPLDID